MLIWGWDIMGYEGAGLSFVVSLGIGFAIGHFSGNMELGGTIGMGAGLASILILRKKGRFR